MSVVSASVPNTAAGAGMMPSGLALLLWAPVMLLVLAGITWLALAAWLDHRREQRISQAVPRTLDVPLEFLRPEAGVQPVQTAPRQLPAAWLDLDLDFGPSQNATRRRVRPL